MSDVLVTDWICFKIKTEDITVKYERYLDHDVFAQYRPCVNKVWDENEKRNTPASFLDSLTLLMIPCPD